MQNIVVLISGRGSNLGSIAQACRRQHWPARIAAVIGGRAAGQGLALASAEGIATQQLAHQDFASREHYEAELAELIDAHNPDWVVLAGFMRILTPAFVARYLGRMVNIHPSLLPSFPGLETHRRALAAGVKIHGATVHFVTPGLDDGPIIAQAAVPVRPDDDESTLAARVLVAEHRLYPMVVRWLVEGRARLLGNQVQWRPPAAGATPASGPLDDAQLIWCP
jgi:phosphoribosylglycinamide formyltransferase-1